MAEKRGLGLIIGGIVLFLVGFLAGFLVAGVSGKSGNITFSDGKTLETKLNEMDSKITDAKKAEEEVRDKLAAFGRRQTGPDPNKVYNFDLTNAPVLGNPDAKVSIVEWSDFQCPYCERMTGILEEIVKKNKDKVKLYYKHRIVHPLAILSHEASIAAQAQGKFWEMADLLFKNRKELTELSRTGGPGNPAENEEVIKKLVSYAKEIGLDVKRFESELRSHKYRPQIDAEQKEATENQINSTPSVFIDGKYQVPDPQAIQNLIDEKIKQQ